MAKKPLPSTAYAVLGLLMPTTPMSGYEIRKAAEQLRYFYWSPAQSQIYSELRRLEALHYVSSILVSQSGKPDKRMYKITSAGQAAFTTWINTAPLDPTVVKHPMKLRLFFGDYADLEQLGQQLQSFIDTSNETLAQLYIVREYREMDPSYQWPGLIAEWSETVLEAEVKYAKSLLIRIQNNDLDSFTEE